ncbi:hypothetical protein DSM107010_45680 [Chroococcidiopsis cubana SAG 39.79]|uniref:Uncharacterized protein n=1 Tax=Chroococcidiopsis cubana SAG 39.79 TaxID=388085 RepID=A0AB37UGC9_9CYAN|nr:hypothetical protein DSM107010_45680 [Chroococcidiopsis cubana SAG 39.79]
MALLDTKIGGLLELDFSVGDGEIGFFEELVLVILELAISTTCKGVGRENFRANCGTRKIAANATHTNKMNNQINLRSFAEILIQ